MDPKTLFEQIRENFALLPTNVLPATTNYLYSEGHTRKPYHKQQELSCIKLLEAALKDHIVDHILMESIKVPFGEGYVATLIPHGHGTSFWRGYLESQKILVKETKWTAIIMKNGIQCTFPCNAALVSSNNITMRVDAFGIYPCLNPIDIEEGIVVVPRSSDLLLTMMASVEGDKSRLSGEVSFYSPHVPGTPIMFPNDVSQSLSDRLKSLGTTLNWHEFEEWYNENIMGDRVLAFIDD
jgi:hypothetical protein